MLHAYLHAVLHGLVPCIASLVGVVDEVCIPVHQVLKGMVRQVQGIKPAVYCLQH
jgi:hypothetical protein